MDRAFVRRIIIVHLIYSPLIKFPSTNIAKATVMSAKSLIILVINPSGRLVTRISKAIAASITAKVNIAFLGFDSFILYLFQISL